MATDATGAPTALGIPKYNTSVDAPSGLGFNAAMDSIDALITARVSKPAGIVSGEVPVWNGSTWVRSTTTNISPTSFDQPRVSATRSGTQAISTGTWTLVNWDTEVYDTDAMHDTSTNPDRITIKTAGTYIFHAVIQVDIPALPVVAEIILQKNSEALPGGQVEVVVQQGYPSFGNSAIVNLTHINRAVVNDYFCINAYQNAAGAGTINAGSSYFTAVRLGG